MAALLCDLVPGPDPLWALVLGGGCIDSEGHRPESETDANSRRKASPPRNLGLGSGGLTSSESLGQATGVTEAIPGTCWGIYRDLESDLDLGIWGRLPSPYHRA